MASARSTRGVRKYPILCRRSDSPNMQIALNQSKSKDKEKLKGEKACVPAESSDSPKRETTKQNLPRPLQPSQKNHSSATRRRRGSRDCQCENTEGHCRHHEQKRERTKAKRAPPEERHQPVCAKREAIQLPEARTCPFADLQMLAAMVQAPAARVSPIKKNHHAIPPEDIRASVGK